MHRKKSTHTTNTSIYNRTKALPSIQGNGSCIYLVLSETACKATLDILMVLLWVKCRGTLAMQGKKWLSTVVTDCTLKDTDLTAGREDTVSAIRLRHVVQCNMCGSQGMSD